MSNFDIYCRPFEITDITERYISWFKDEEIVQFLEARDLTFDEVAEFSQLKRGQTRFMMAICLNDTHLHVGNIKIDVNWRHSTAILSILVGDKKYWRKQVATNAIKIATQMAFYELGIRKINAGLYEKNLGSLKCFENADWSVDYVSRSEKLFDGVPINSIHMTKFNDKEWQTKLPPNFIFERNRHL